MKNIIGKVLLNQFRVDAFVAAGGMGTVYRVWDLKRNVYLAMKVLHSDLAEDPSAIKLFRREANALKKLAHPNIVPFYGLYQSDNLAFLLERFIDGPSLKELLRQHKGKPLSVEEALIYLKALTAALGYAHAHGVVHCDVKPGNVMVDRGDNIYLTDFGIARHAESTTTTLATAGTAAYMAPEQIRGQQVTPATDVYALGIMLFEMLTGRRPFRGDEVGTVGDESSVGERIRNAQLNLLPTDPLQFNENMPDALAQVILTALEKSPGERFSSMQALYIEACKAIGTNPEIVPERVEQADSEKLDPPDRSKTGLWVALGLICVAVIILSGITWYLWKYQMPPFTVTPTVTPNLPVTEVVITPSTPDPQLPTFSPTPLPIQTQIPSPIPSATSRPRTSPTITNIPTSTPNEPPRLLLDKNYFCRGGPGTNHTELWTFLEGDELEILGQYGDIWWLVKIDDQRTRKVRCWIGGGTPSGNISQVPHSNWTGDGYTP